MQYCVRDGYAKTVFLRHSSSKLSIWQTFARMFLFKYNSQWLSFWFKGSFPESKVHEVKMVPTCVLSATDGPHVVPMNLAIRVVWKLQHSTGVMLGDSVYRVFVCFGTKWRHHHSLRDPGLYNRHRSSITIGQCADGAALSSLLIPLTCTTCGYDRHC